MKNVIVVRDFFLSGFSDVRIGMGFRFVAHLDFFFPIMLDGGASGGCDRSRRTGGAAASGARARPGPFRGPARRQSSAEGGNAGGRVAAAETGTRATAGAGATGATAGTASVIGAGSAWTGEGAGAGATGAGAVRAGAPAGSGEEPLGEGRPGCWPTFSRSAAVRASAESNEFFRNDEISPRVQNFR